MQMQKFLIFIFLHSMMMKDVMLLSQIFLTLLYIAFYSYYKSDAQIQADWELQGFVDEISADGSVPNGGKVDIFFS